MNVTVVTLARDLGQWAEPLAQQLEALKRSKTDFRFVVVEGDSIDQTYTRLAEWRNRDDRVTLLKIDTGVQKYGHMVSIKRFEHIAWLVNQGLDEAIADGWPDYVMVMPGDVEIEPDIATRLLKHKVDYVAPMFWVREGTLTRFYDSWGFTKDGVHWRPMPKAWYASRYSGLVEMDTVGGLVMVNANLIEAGCRYGKTNVDHGFCIAAREQGATIYADTDTHIYHR